nr:hypothetical protein CFP56_57688 [Quercus suber]
MRLDVKEGEVFQCPGCCEVSDVSVPMPSCEHMTDTAMISMTLRPSHHRAYTVQVRRAETTIESSGPYLIILSPSHHLTIDRRITAPLDAVVRRRTTKLRRCHATPPCHPHHLHDRLGATSTHQKMTLHLGLPHTHHRSSEQQQDIRDAKRMLKDRVRDDWDFPALPQFRKRTRRPAADVSDEVDANAVARIAGVDDVQNGIAGFRFHSTYAAPTWETHPDLDAVEWRERDYSSEELDDEDAVGSSAAQKARNKTVGYKFEGPDSVGTQISSRREARAQRREQRLQEETQWNAGLEHWLQRRDLWCAARTKGQAKNRDTSGNNAAPAGPEIDASSIDSPHSASPRTSMSATSVATTSTVAEPRSAYASASTTPDLDPTPQAPQTQPRHQVQTMMVPVMPQILPNHPIRRRITPSIYTEIYTKIILQSRTPSVPINLSTLVSALVKGWKDDGEWPPKPGAPEASVARKKGGAGKAEGGGFRNGVKAVGRALRLAGTGTEDMDRKHEALAEALRKRGAYRTTSREFRFIAFPSSQKTRGSSMRPKSITMQPLHSGSTYGEVDSIVALEQSSVLEAKPEKGEKHSVERRCGVRHGDAIVAQSAFRVDLAEATLRTTRTSWTGEQKLDLFASVLCRGDVSTRRQRGVDWVISVRGHTTQVFQEAVPTPCTHTCSEICVVRDGLAFGSVEWVDVRVRELQVALGTFVHAGLEGVHRQAEEVGDEKRRIRRIRGLAGDVRLLALFREHGAVWRGVGRRVVTGEGSDASVARGDNRR